MFITCGYDEERRREDRKNERWIPMAKQADGSEPTRQQVLEEARKLTENNGIQLMHDGITFKIRVPSGKEEEGWRQILSKPPPPNVIFVADGLPGSIPNKVIEQVMKETLDWDESRESHCQKQRQRSDKKSLSEMHRKTSSRHH